MNSGTGLVETWIPDGGFEIQRRKVKTPDGGTVVTDCLVPKWTGDDLTADRPLHRQPCSCLHRVLAACRHDQIVAMANNYGLLTVTVARKPDPGKPVHADLLPPEPVQVWHLAAVRPRGRRHHPVCEVPGAELRKVVPPQRRPQRPPVLLTEVPDARLAACPLTAPLPRAATGGSHPRTPARRPGPPGGAP